jgi:hypothetical protein
MISAVSTSFTGVSIGATVHVFTVPVFTVHVFTVHVFTVHVFTVPVFTVHVFAVPVFVVVVFTFPVFTVEVFVVEVFVVVGLVAPAPLVVVVVQLVVVVVPLVVVVVPLVVVFVVAPFPVFVFATGVSIFCSVVLATMVIETFMVNTLSAFLPAIVLEFQIIHLSQSIFKFSFGSGVISNFFSPSISPPVSLDAMR